MSSVFWFTPPPLMILFFGVLGIGLPAIIILILLYKEDYRSKKSIATFVFLTVFAFVFTTIIFWHYQTNIEIDMDKLIINVPPYTTKVIEKGDIVRAVVVDWKANTSFTPTLRTGGTGWGSYKTGWFTLSNGASALLITSSTENLCIETKEGYYILLNPGDFDLFKETYYNNF
jgi:hypothetical protein